jgi:hypothetical protein
MRRCRGLKLREIAHSRTGDKGDISNISVIAYRIEDYEKIREQLTVEKVGKWFENIVQGEIVRYELPKLGALNFVMYKALGGGVTRSLSIDMHGKSLSSALLGIELDE